MSRIDDLISELAPQGVRYRRVGDVFETVATPPGIKRSDYSLGKTIPIVDQGQSLIAGYTDNGSFKIDDGPYVVFGDHTRAVKWIDFPFAVGADGTKVLKAKSGILLKYLYYAMANLDIFDRGYNRHWTIVRDIRIPVPPREVQREIVRVLDNFAQLEAELEAELQARRAQLAYYRGAILGDTVSASQTAPLGDIAEFKYGFTDIAAEAGTHRFIRITDINPQGKLSADGAKYVSPGSSASEYVVQPGDLLMARTGATYGKTLLVNTDVPAVFASFLIRIRFKDSQLLPAFYWHYAQSNAYWNQANALVSTAGQPQFNANALKRVRVPLPSLEKQASIVRTLNTFDALVNDISIGLPAELAARRKQYEYYRDRLLTFKELTE